jgi:hypothetical protein
MRRFIIATAAVLFTIGTAGATDDWNGVLKAQAAYDTANQPQLNITVDVVYDKPGRASRAWGTLSYMHPAQAISSAPKLRIYAHPLCVGVFNSGNNASVAGQIVQALGAATPDYIVFEFDVLNKRIRTVTKTTEAAARAMCVQQSGIFPGVFNHGYVIVN